MKFDLTQLTKVLAKRFNLTPEELLGSFCPAVISDLDDVLAFRAISLNCSICWSDKAYLRWRYNFGNDESHSINRKNRLWIFRIGGEIVGIIGVQRLPLIVEGQSFEAFTPLDLLVRQALDGSGLGAWMTAAIQDHYSILIAIGATEKSKGLLKRMFHSMPDRQLWKLPISSKGIFQRQSRHFLVTTVGTLFVDMYLLVSRRIQLHPGLLRELQVETPHRFPPEINELNDSWKQSDLIFVERNHAFLNWRFFDNPETNNKLVTVKKDGTILGYAIFSTFYAPENQQYQATINDIFWRRNGDSVDNDKTLRRILAAAITDMLGNKIKMVSINSYIPAMSTTLQKIGFRRREESLPFSVYTDQPELEPLLHNPRKWFLTNAEAHGANV